MRGEVERDEGRCVAERQGREPVPDAAAVDQPSAKRRGRGGEERERRDREAGLAVGASRALDREQHGQRVHPVRERRDDERVDESAGGSLAEERCVAGRHGRPKVRG